MTPEHIRTETETQALEVIEIKCRCICGTEIYMAAKEAAALALKRFEKVTFVHNGRTFTADPQMLVRVVLGNVLGNASERKHKTRRNHLHDRPHPP
jgi:hypothetical protein